MNNLFKIVALSFLIFGCSKQKEVALNKRVSQFQVSECKKDCGKDSIGVRSYKTKNNALKIRLGYILNCSWKKGYFKNIEEQNDTLIVELDRPHSEEGDYPVTDCNCFLYFDFMIKNYNKSPKAIRVKDLFEENKFWDENSFKEIYEIEETIIELE